MPNLLYTLLSPVLLLVSLPLAIFACLTTAFAFSTLFFRVLVVYAELAAVLVQNQFSAQTISMGALSTDKVATPDEKDSRRKSRRSSAGSLYSGSMTPKIPESSGLGIYSGGGIGRDFEGVGGWRFPGPDDEDVLWTSMNSRLELPATISDHKRNHHRSLTSGSLSSVPLTTRSPVRSRARTPSSTRATGTTSPEEYFTYHSPSNSLTVLDTANVGRVLLRPKNSSISTFSTENSNRTLHIRIP